MYYHEQNSKTEYSVTNNKKEAPRRNYAAQHHICKIFKMSISEVKMCKFSLLMSEDDKIELDEIMKRKEIFMCYTLQI